MVVQSWERVRWGRTYRRYMRDTIESEMDIII